MHICKKAPYKENYVGNAASQVNETLPVDYDQDGNHWHDTAA